MRKNKNLSNTKHGFLVELQVEDIPVRFLEKSKNNLTQSIIRLLGELKIAAPADNFSIWLTPKRIAVFIKNLPEATLARNEVVLGPKEDSLQDGFGRFTARATGFAKSHEISCEELLLENGRITYTKTIPPKKVVEILKEKLPEILFSIPFPKTMRWESSHCRFARPIRGLVACWDKKVLRDWRWVPGVIAGPYTYAGKEKIKITDAFCYEKKLAKKGLLLDIKRKKERLEREWSQKVRNMKPAEVLQESLLKELLNLVEIPKVVLGKLDTKLLILPNEVISAILGKLKLFTLYKESQIQPYFAAVVEKPKKDAFLKNITQGYSNVTTAKLLDAKFFWEQDQKQSLEACAEKLKGIIFSKEMGSLWDKVQRVRNTSRILAGYLSIDPQDFPLLDRAAQLYKADLATGLVGEYPELAGKIGSYYANARGENARVCLAILESAELKPTSNSPLGLVLGLAERLDTLVAQFALGNKPSATEDPLGLKKITDIIVETLWRGPLNCSIREMVNAAWESFGALNQDPRKELLEYFKLRLGLQAREYFAHDKVEATLLGSHFKDLPVAAIVRSLEIFQQLADNEPETVASMAQSFKRTSNILRQAEKLQGQKLSFEKIEEALFAHETEVVLWNQIKGARVVFEEALSRSSYEEAFRQAAKFTHPLEEFFKHVMVIVDEEKIKRNRLALLNDIHSLILNLMDPAKLLLSETKQPPSPCQASTLG